MPKPQPVKETLKSEETPETEALPSPSEPPPLPSTRDQVPTVKSIKLKGSVFGLSKLSISQGFVFDWDGVREWVYVTKGDVRELIPFGAMVSMRVSGKPDDE